jgi:glucokinase
MIIAGDIGGTKTHLAIFEGKDFKIVREKKYQSKNHVSLSRILKDFFSLGNEKIDGVCLGIAGPIQDQICRATNLPWIINAKEIAREFKIEKVWLLNDLEANAYGTLCLKPEDIFVLNKGVINGKGNAALISAGTGLGEAGLYWDGEKHRPFACEGGHSDFAPRDEEEIELWRYLRKKFDHVSFERVLSGPGLFNIYQFLVESGKEKETESLKKEFADKDPPRVIVDMALNKGEQICVRALEWFVSIYGSEAGNLALKFLATDGVYVGGGIAPNILKVMESGIFIRSFIAKGRFSSLLYSIPVKVILKENTALLGAAYYANEKV